jgi:sec-independent protein translocase protein TatA
MPTWIGMPELILIFLIVLLLFGANKLPEIARSMGKSIQAFKKSSKEITDEITKELPAKDDTNEDAGKKSDT